MNAEGGWLESTVGPFPTSSSAAGRDLFDTVRSAGARRWPEVDLPPALFFDYLRRLGDGLNRSDATHHAGDLYLAFACLERHPKALGAFEAEYLARAPQFVSRIGHDREFVQEVTQALRERLLVAHPPEPPRLATYAGRASLLSWVAVCAQRIALDQRRARKTDDVAADSQLGTSITADTETLYLKRRYSRVFEAAITTALARMPAKERVLLRLWLYEQLSMERIGAMYRVNVSTVSRWLSKARASLSADIEALVRERLGVTEVEFASLSRLIHSQIDATVLRDLQLSR